MELERLRKQWQEAQTTLEELGIQLSVSKIQVHELKEKVQSTKSSNADKQAQQQQPLLGSTDPGGGNGGTWTPDSMTSNCKGCHREFTITRRKVTFI